MSIIAVSRGTFSGGQAVAECVAERLGYRILGRDDLVEAATRYGVPEDEVATAMDKPPSFWERLTGAKRTIYLHSIRAALCEQARQGKLVYHGHMGHLLLPGVSHVIAVRVIADMEFRIATAMEQRNVTRDQAVADIRRIDRERAAWAQFLHGAQWDDPSLYDAVIKLGRIGMDSACEMVAGMARLREFQPTPESIKSMEDLTLGSLVSARLATDPRTLVTDVGVSADGGVVTIGGVVDWQATVEAIPLVAREVDGVREVKNEVRSMHVIPESA
jgi:osmotically-inducible protein OsmY